MVKMSKKLHVELSPALFWIFQFSILGSVMVTMMMAPLRSPQVSLRNFQFLISSVTKTATSASVVSRMSLRIALVICLERELAGWALNLAAGAGSKPLTNNTHPNNNFAAFFSIFLGNSYSLWLITKQFNERKKSQRIFFYLISERRTKVWTWSLKIYLNVLTKS